MAFHEQLEKRQTDRTRQFRHGFFEIGTRPFAVIIGQLRGSSRTRDGARLEQPQATIVVEPFEIHWMTEYLFNLLGRTGQLKQLVVRQRDATHCIIRQRYFAKTLAGHPQRLSLPGDRPFSNPNGLAVLGHLNHILVRRCAPIDEGCRKPRNRIDHHLSRSSCEGMDGIGHTGGSRL